MKYIKCNEYIYSFSPATLNHSNALNDSREHDFYLVKNNCKCFPLN